MNSSIALENATLVEQRARYSYHVNPGMLRSKYRRRSRACKHGTAEINAAAAQSVRNSEVRVIKRWRRIAFTQSRKTYETSLIAMRQSLLCSISRRASAKATAFPLKLILEASCLSLLSIATFLLFPCSLILIQCSTRRNNNNHSSCLL